MGFVWKGLFPCDCECDCGTLKTRYEMTIEDAPPTEGVWVKYGVVHKPMVVSKHGQVLAVFGTEGVNSYRSTVHAVVSAGYLERV